MISGDVRIPASLAMAALRTVRSLVEPHCRQLEVAGSLRRGRSRVHDIDLVVMCDTAGRQEIASVLWTHHAAGKGAQRSGDKMLSSLGWWPVDDEGASLVRTLYGRTEENTVWRTRAEGRTEVFCPVDVYVASPENYGMLLLVRTGSAQHNILLATRAKAMGLKFAAGSGIEKDGKVIAGRTEGEVFRALGLKWVAPARREVSQGRPMWQEES